MTQADPRADPPDRRRRFAAWVWTLVVLVACSMPGDDLPSTGMDLPVDKAVHFGLFLVFGGLWLHAGARVVPLLLLGGLYAVALEPYQGLLPTGRSPEVLDAVMNLAGLGAAIVGTRLVRRTRAERPGGRSGKTL